MSPADVTHTADELNVVEKDVIDMNQRMAGGDKSLNVTPTNDLISLASGRNHGVMTAPIRKHNLPNMKSLKRGELMMNAMQNLNEREMRIIEARRLNRH